MAKRPEKPVYAFLPCGNSLVPEYDYDLKALDGVTNGQRVKVEIKEFRNAARARAYWAMLHDVVEATGTVLTAERLHEVLKLENGVIDTVRLPNGITVAIPGSIAFDKMSEAEFVSFFAKAQEWLARTYGFVPEDQRRVA